MKGRRVRNFYMTPAEPLQKTLLQPTPGLAVCAGVTGGNRRVGGSIPRLEKPEGFRARRVGFENLGHPGPKHWDMPELALAFGWINLLEKRAGKKRLEQERVTAERLLESLLPDSPNCRL